MEPSPTTVAVGKNLRKDQPSSSKTFRICIYLMLLKVTAILAEDTRRMAMTTRRMAFNLTVLNFLSDMYALFLLLRMTLFLLSVLFYEAMSSSFTEVAR